jgi:hypothetical protein
MTRHVRFHTDQKQNVEDVLYDLIYERLRAATTATRTYTGISNAKLTVNGDTKGLFGTADLKEEGEIEFEIKVKVRKVR